VSNIQTTDMSNQDNTNHNKPVRKNQKERIKSIKENRKKKKRIKKIKTTKKKITRKK
jgi:hypothetical protein